MYTLIQRKQEEKKKTKPHLVILRRTGEIHEKKKRKLLKWRIKMEQIDLFTSRSSWWLRRQKKKQINIIKK